MRVLFFCCTVLLIGAVSQVNKAQALSKATGVGIILGAPTGISFEHHRGARRSFDAAIGYGFSGANHVHMHGDDLFHFPHWIHIDNVYINTFLGYGVRLRFEEDSKNDDDDLNLGARFPIGVSYIIKEASLKVFLEASAVLEVIPDTSFDVDLGLGARYFF